MVSEIHYPYYDLWNNEAEIVIFSFNNELVLLVHWWQRQASIEGSLRGDERPPDTPSAKLCAQPRRSCTAFRGITATALIWRLVQGQMFSVMFSRDEYFFYILLSIQILLVVDKVHIAVIGDASYSHWYPSHYKLWHEMQPWLRCSLVNQAVHRWLTISVPWSYDTSLYLNGLYQCSF